MTGTSAISNAFDGVIIQLGASGNTVGGMALGAGNLISGNIEYGVEITGAGTAGNVVVGNLIGTTAAGNAPLANQQDGISINSSAMSNIIGGVALGAGNVISGNSGDGIDLVMAFNNTIAGNMIGTNLDDTAGVGNSGDGIVLSGSSGNTIGPKNVISGNGTPGNTGVGVYIYNNSLANVLQGNFIGTNADGSRAITGSAIGVLINSVSANVVQSNVISGNRVIGIEIFGASASGNRVEDNLIGTNAAGIAAIPNGADGIFINNAPGNTIGGTTASQGNVISGNLQVGIQIFGLDSRGNVIENNKLGRNKSGGTGPHLLNGDSGDLGIYVNTTPTINTIVANVGQGLRDSPTGAPFDPGDPASASQARARALRLGKHARPFAHRPFRRAAAARLHTVKRFSHR